MLKEQDVRKIVATNVREYRTKLDVSQEKLAELADLHRTFIGFIERAERTITVYTLYKLAKGLRVTPAQLITENSFRESDPKKK